MHMPTAVSVCIQVELARSSYTCSAFQATFWLTPAMTSGWVTTGATATPGTTAPWIHPKTRSGSSGEEILDTLTPPQSELLINMVQARALYIQCYKAAETFSKFRD